MSSFDGWLGGSYGVDPKKNKDEEKPFAKISKFAEDEKRNRNNATFGGKSLKADNTRKKVSPNDDFSSWLGGDYGFNPEPKHNSLQDMDWLERDLSKFFEPAKAKELMQSYNTVNKVLNKSKMPFPKSNGAETLNQGSIGNDIESNSNFKVTTINVASKTDPKTKIEIIPKREGDKIVSYEIECDPSYLNDPAKLKEIGELLHVLKRHTKYAKEAFTVRLSLQ